MKKIIFVLLVSLLFGGCVSREEEKKPIKDQVAECNLDLNNASDEEKEACAYGLGKFYLESFESGSTCSEIDCSGIKETDENTYAFNCEDFCVVNGLEEGETGAFLSEKSCYARLTDFHVSCN